MKRPSFFLFGWRFFEKTGKSVELLFPELAVVLHPFHRGLHRLSRQAAAMNPSVLAPGDEPGSFEHTQMLGDAGKRDVERCRKVTNGSFTLSEARQDSAAGSIGKGCKGGAEKGLGTLNHVV